MRPSVGMVKFVTVSLTCIGQLNKFNACEEKMICIIALFQVMKPLKHVELSELVPGVQHTEGSQQSFIFYAVILPVMGFEGIIEKIITYKPKNLSKL
jgi:hypothetical protein